MAKNLRKLGALLLAAALCLGLLGTSALAVNDTEFHIMDFDGIKGYLVREGVSKEDIQIYSIYVHDENGRTACGIYHLTPYFGAGADTGIQGTNGIATHGGSQY